MEPSQSKPTRWASDRGEVGSWLVLAAGLAFAATAAVGTMQVVMSNLTSDVGEAAEVAVGTSGGSVGTTGPNGPTGTAPSGPGTGGPTGTAPSGPGTGGPTGTTPSGPGTGGPTGTAPSGPSGGTGEPTQQELDAIDDLIDALPEEGPNHEQFAALQEAISEAFDDPDLASAILEYAAQGYPIDIAIALATGDWSDIEGGDPGEYSDDQISTILRALGFDPSESLDGADELLDSLDPGLLALLFHEGREYELTLTPGSLGTPGSLILPVSGSASIEASASVSLSNPSIGVDFDQTQSVDITARIIGRVEGTAGKSTLGKVYKQLGRLGFVPDSLKAFVDRNPLLKGALKGVPFSVAYSEYVGTELAYEATITTAQGAAVDNGDLSALPDIYNPESFEPGNSVLIRAGAIEGSDFMLKYKVLQLDANNESFDGLGFGVTALGDGTVAIFAGDIEAVENSIGIGPGFAQLGATKRLSQYDLDYAILDLNTPEGQAAYDEFITGGGVPHQDANGVTTANSTVVTGEYDLGVSVNIGPININETLNSNEHVVETLTYANGEQVTTIDASYNGDKATQVVVPHNASGQLDFDQAEVTIVLGGLSSGSTQTISLGYDGDTSGPGIAPEGNHDVQLTFTAPELIELQQSAQQAVRNTAYDDRGNINQAGYDAAIANPTNFTQLLAAAQGVEEIIQVITMNSPSLHAGPVEGLATIAIYSVWDDDSVYDAELPGSIEIRPAG